MATPKRVTISCLTCVLLSAAIGFLLSPGVAWAGESPLPALSLEEALSVGLAANPDSRIVELGLEAAAGERRTASQRQNPELTAVPGVKRSRGPESSGDEFYGEFGLSQLVEFPGKRALRVNVAEKGVEQRKLAIEAFRSRLTLEIRRQFYSLLVAQQVVGLREQQGQTARRFVESVRGRLEGGYSSEFDMLKAESELLTAEKLIRESELKVGDIRARLNVLLGRTPDAALRIVGDLSRVDTARAPDRAGERAIQENVAYRAAVIAAEKADAQVEAARLEKYPNLTVGPVVEYLQDEQTYKLELSVPLPLLHRGEGEVQTATAKKRSADADIERVKRGILAAIDSAQRAHESARKKLELYSARFLSKLKDLATRAERGYAENSVPLLIYLDTRRTYFDTMVDYYEATGDAVLSLVDLDAAISLAPTLDTMDVTDETN